MSLRYVLEAENCLRKLRRVNEAARGECTYLRYVCRGVNDTRPYIMKGKRPVTWQMLPQLV